MMKIGRAEIQKFSSLAPVESDRILLAALAKRHALREFEAAQAKLDAAMADFRLAITEARVSAPDAFAECFEAPSEK